MHLLKPYKTKIRYFIIFSILFFYSCKSRVNLTSIDRISPNNSQHFQTTPKDIQRNLQGNSIEKINIKKDNRLNVYQENLCDVILLKDGSKIYAKEYEKTENGINYKDCNNSKFNYVSNPEVFYIHEYTSSYVNKKKSDNIPEKNIVKKISNPISYTEIQKKILKNYFLSALGCIVPFLSFFTMKKGIKNIKLMKNEKWYFKLLNWLSLIFSLFGLIFTFYLTIVLALVAFGL